MAETLRCIFWSSLISRVADSMRSHLQLLQLDIENSGGMETLAHGTIRVHDHSIHYDSHVILTVELKKAFNLVSHDVFLER